MSNRSKLLMAPTYKVRIPNLLSKMRLSQLNRMGVQRCKECMHSSKETIYRRGFFLKWGRKNLCKIYWPHVWSGSLRVCHRVFFRREPYRYFCRHCRFFCWFFIRVIWRRPIFQLQEWFHPYIWLREQFWIRDEFTLKFKQPWPRTRFEGYVLPGYKWYSPDRIDSFLRY